MKKPVLHITTEAQVDQAVNWLYSGRFTICNTPKDVGRKMLVERLKRTDGANLYYVTRLMLDVCNHPMAWNHMAYTRVNSLAHFKHYLNRNNL